MANSQESDKIEASILEALSNMDGYDEGDILVEWAVVAYVDNPDKEAGHGYPMFFSNGQIPTYRARGLLQTGLKFLNELDD